MKICKVCGNPADLNYEGTCLECSMKRIKDDQEKSKQIELVSLQNNEEPSETKAKVEASVNTLQIINKMDAQIGILSKIHFWVRFWSVLTIIIFVIYLLLFLISSI